MAPLELIKNGIMNADWNRVVQGYNNLTGEELKAPVVETNGAPKHQWTEEELTRLPLRYKNRPNLFAEDLELMSAHKDDSILQQKLTPANKRFSTRKRKAPKYVEASCKVCQKKIKIRQDLIIKYENGEAADTYCDSCCKGA